jgi:hypothetical protein
MGEHHRMQPYLPTFLVVADMVSHFLVGAKIAVSPPMLPQLN